MSNCMPKMSVSDVPPTCFSALKFKEKNNISLFVPKSLLKAFILPACVPVLWNRHLTAFSLSVQMFLFSGCTCVTAGTIQSACSDGQCHCDRQTGACPCRENVAGHNCDQCAPNHWNYGQDQGCELCGCDPQHALGTHCNMVRKHEGLGKPENQ